jgi:hypothetical protein
MRKQWFSKFSIFLKAKLNLVNTSSNHTKLIEFLLLIISFTSGTQSRFDQHNRNLFDFTSDRQVFDFKFSPEMELTFFFFLELLSNLIQD